MRSDVIAFTRFLWELRGYARRRLTPAQARTIIRQRLAERESNLAGVLERSVFRNTASPYRRLLALARIEPGDVRSMIAADGVEATLRRLRGAGVYVSFEEFKGTRPIVRDGVEVSADARSFDQPHARAYYRAETGGTTGVSRLVQTDVAHLWARVPQRLLMDEVHGMLGLPSALWFEALPGNGPQSILLRAPYDAVPARWFTPVSGGRRGSALKYRVANRAIVKVARLSGIRFPRPEHVPLQRADVVAQWVAETVRSHGGCALYTHPSKALRVCLAARERGLDLTGAIFSGGGEPVTAAKVSEMAAVGARFVSSYIAMETGAIGVQCANPDGPNDQHFLSDHLAVIQHPRELPGSDATVDTFHFTTLLPSSPRLLLNVELDDYGAMTTRHCGCAFEALGLLEHIQDIRSFRKFTGEGMTLVGTDVERVLEAELPARCGGSALDYQLVEEEDDHGLTRLTLVVSPHVPASDDELLAILHAALRCGSAAAVLAGTVWAQGSNLRVRRAATDWTARGKHVPFVPLRRPTVPPRTGA